MSTAISLCSAALLLIGADEISSFDDGSRAAKICANLYPRTRDDVLQSYPWRFATAQERLAKLVTLPLYGYSYAYQLPANCLRVMGLEGQADFNLFEGRLYTNSAEARITYIARVSENRMPTSVQRGLELKMAEILAVSLVEDVSKSQLFGQKAEQQLQRARVLDAQQQTASVLPDAQFSLVMSRG